MLSSIFYHCWVWFLTITMFNLIFQFLNIATQPPPTTEPPTGIPTYAPAAQLYHRTTDYHWPKFSDNATKTDGPNKWSTGDGPFGFGSSVKLEDNTVSFENRAKWMFIFSNFANKRLLRENSQFSLSRDRFHPFDWLSCKTSAIFLWYEQSRVAVYLLLPR